MMCRVLKVSTSGFYGWCQRGPSQHELDDHRFKLKIREVFDSNRRAYGAFRIWKDFKKNGIECGRDRTLRLFNEMGLEAIETQKKGPKTTQSDHDYEVYENVLDRKFKAGPPNKVLLADITYVPTQDGWLYLSTVMDLGTRKLVGWSMRESLHKEGALDALEMALKNRTMSEGWIHHSDRGVQYASKSYQSRLRQAGAKVSMSRKGNCWDNAPMESFFGRMKAELLIDGTQGIEETKHNIFMYIETYYNTRRRHSALDYETPVDFEQHFAA